MSDRVFNLTMDQVKIIFLAGIRRGRQEEASTQTGNWSAGRRYDDLADAIYDVYNEGKGFDDPDFADMQQIEKWIKNNA